MTGPSREDSATLHLHLWLTALNRTLRAAIADRTARIEALRRDPSPHGGVSPAHAGELLDRLERDLRHGPRPLPPIALDAREAAAEARMIREAPVTLPLARLTRDAGLGDFERQALLIVAAPQLMPDYAPLYGYLVDDLTRTHASIEAILILTGGPGTDSGRRRRMLGPGGALRRLGLVLADDPLDAGPALRLSLAPGLLDWLLGATAAPPVPLSDPRLLWPESAEPPAPVPLRAAVVCLATAANGVAGLWAPDPNRHDDLVMALAGHVQRPVYRARRAAEPALWTGQIREDAAIASGADALLWIETRALPGTDDEAETLAGLTARMVLTGRTPWRPPALIGSRPYADVMVDPATLPIRWPLSDDSLPAADLGRLDATHRLGWRERQAAVRVALSERRNAANGTVPNLAETLPRACALVASPAQMRSVSLVTPRRTLDELILTTGLHDQIGEIGRLYARAGLVDGAWGFGRLTGSTGAIKALFTGDPGTGKTMAAEVVAGQAGIALMKVDLAQVVSKWVGETEKNLEAVFDHAEQSRAALFFDEADALFGKRGEVRHGTDRYANLEVSYLLERLERYSGGLVILASNLRDDIDPAFTRRFQVALHFPRPGREQRLRLWRLAFAAAPLSDMVDLNQVAALDLTGGAIVAAARMAALLAAAEASPVIDQTHLDAATERQFRKEARLMATDRPDGLSVARGRA
jgi:hypothetical protein